MAGRGQHKVTRIIPSVNYQLPYKHNEKVMYMNVGVSDNIIEFPHMSTKTFISVEALENLLRLIKEKTD